MPRPFAIVGITFFLTLVILANVSEKIIWVIFIVSVLCVIPIVLMRNLKKPSVIPVACISVIAASMLYLTAEKVLYNPVVVLAGEGVEFSGQIVEYPQFENDRFYYLIKTEKIKGVHKKTIIRFSTEEPIDAQLYDRISTKAAIYILGEHNEDSLQYYKTTGIYLGAYSQDSCVTVQSNSEKPLLYYILTFKQELIDGINYLLPNENGGLLVALLFGDKTYLSDKTIADFSNAGVSHIMAVSGLNLSMFSLLFIYLFEKTKLNKRVGYFCSFLFILGFMALAGFTASVLRAGFMLLVIILGKIINKQADSLNSLGLAVLLISLINPLSAAYVGLQLSFFASLGIITAQKRLMKPFEDKLKLITQCTLQKILHFVLDSVIITVAASLFTLPIILLYFNKVSLISLLANLIMVYISSLAMIFGGVAAICFIIPGLSVFANPLSITAGFMTNFILKSSELIAKIPYSSLSINGKFIFIWLSCSLIMISVAVLFEKKMNKDYLRLTAILCTITLLIAVCSNAMFNYNTTKVTIVDVGNASSVVISHRGRAALIACGGDRFNSKGIINAFELNNIRSLDLLLIPRTALTESNAALDIMNNYKPKEIVMPETNYSLDFIHKTNNSIISKKYEKDLWDNFKVQYIYSEDLSCAYAEISGTSILFIFYPGCNFEKVPIKWRTSKILICRSKPPVDCDKLRFETVIVSCDEPIPNDIVEEYKTNGINLYSTSNLGNIMIKTQDNDRYTVRRAD